MKTFKNLTPILTTIIFTFIFFTACQKDDGPKIDSQEAMVDVGGFDLLTVTSGQGTATVVFESGMGNNQKVWLENNLIKRTADIAQVIAYNRASICHSTS